jgi:hypothetical protein
VGHQEHPERTPVYGALLVAGAMVSAVLVTYWTHPPTAVRIVVLIAALAAAAVGVFMTMRDLPNR